MTTPAPTPGEKVKLYFILKIYKASMPYTELMNVFLLSDQKD